MSFDTKNCFHIVVWLQKNSVTHIIYIEQINSIQRHLITGRPKIWYHKEAERVFFNPNDFRLSPKKENSIHFLKNVNWSIKFLIIFYTNQKSLTLSLSYDPEKKVLFYIYILFSKLYHWTIWLFPTVVATIKCFREKVRIKMLLHAMGDKFVEKARSCTSHQEIK